MKSCPNSPSFSPSPKRIWPKLTGFLRKWQISFSSAFSSTQRKDPVLPHCLNTPSSTPIEITTKLKNSKLRLYTRKTSIESCPKKLFEPT